MANLAITYTFSPLTKAKSSEVNTNYSDIQTWLNNRDNGTDYWLKMFVLGTSANPAEIKSSSADCEFDIDCTGTNGTPRITWKRSGTSYFTAGVDGAASNLLKFGTTSLTTNVAMQIPTVGAQVQFAAGTSSLPSISAIGDTNTGRYFSASDTMIDVAGGNSVMQINSNGLTVLTGYIAAQDGATGTPSITFANDAGLNSGFFYAGSGAFAATVNGTRVIDFDAALKCRVDLNPNGTGSQNLGNGTDYWGDISYKTLTDRGCLPWADDGVELQDGSIVSDCEALSQIKKHPTKLTVHGLPMLDYSTFPKVSYKKEEVGSDGIEMTSVFGFMIGAIKELHGRVKVFEGK